MCWNANVPGGDPTDRRSQAFAPSGGEAGNPGGNRAVHRQPAAGGGIVVIDFQTDPSRYRHWKLSFDGPVATLSMDVDPAGGLMDGYELKLNSYDLGVDIELADAVQRLRFEHPEVKSVILRSAKEGVFCAGANIRMLGKASHGHKVNFCKFTNETRLSIEDASANSGQRWLAAVSGSAAGGGYELAVTADHIMLIDDRRSSVSLPELPLLAVLPGTGGLTRLTDKRRVRRDRADIFCTAEEGVRGKRAVDWRLVDEVVPPSAWEAKVHERALELAARSDRPADAKGITLTALERTISDDAMTYPHVRVALDRAELPAPRSPSLGRVPDVARRPARHPRQRCGLLASGDGSGTGRCLAASAVERTVDWVDCFSFGWRSGLGAGSRQFAGAIPGRLAGARNPPAAEACAEARRYDGTQPYRPDRAGKLLRRHPR